MLQWGRRELFLLQATIWASILTLHIISANVTIQSNQGHFVSPYEALIKGITFNLHNTVQLIYYVLWFCQT